MREASGRGAASGKADAAPVLQIDPVSHIGVPEAAQQDFRTVRSGPLAGGKWRRVPFTPGQRRGRIGHSAERVPRPLVPILHYVVPVQPLTSLAASQNQQEQDMRKWQLAAAFVVVVFAAGLAFMSTRPHDEPPVVSFEDAAVRMRIDISDRKLYVEADGSPIKSYNVAVGAAGHPTPRGAFSVSRLIWNPRWVPPDSDWAKGEKVREPGDPKNPMGRVKIFFKEPTYYIHGTNAESSIGTAASHGCVRMLNDEVIDLARLLIDRSGTPVEPGLIQRLINRVRQTRELQLEAPVPLRVQS